MAQPDVSPMPDDLSSPWRDDFPIFRTQPDFAYLDTASSAQKPDAVIARIRAVMEGEYANIHRGLYQLSQNLTEEYEAVRQSAMAFLNAPAAEGQVIFTRNATEAVNLVAQSWGRTFLEAGDEVILSEMEHHANIVPWQILRDQIGIKIQVVRVTDDGMLDLDDLSTKLSTRTKLVSLVHISNSLGTINPVQKIKETVKSFNADIIIMFDGSQAAVHGPVNLAELDPDFYFLTGHKLYGPTGVGVLYGRADLLNQMPPYQGGGDMIERVRFDRTTYKDAPFKFEAGTPPILEVVGLGRAIKYISEIGMEKVAAHEHALYTAARAALEEIEGLHFYGDHVESAAILSFTAEWAHISDIAMILDQCGVAVRTGHHCCMPLMKRYGIEGTVRASFGVYNDGNDIDKLRESLKKAQNMLK